MAYNNTQLFIYYSYLFIFCYLCVTISVSCLCICSLAGIWLTWAGLQTVGWVQDCSACISPRPAWDMFLCDGRSVKIKQKLAVSLKASTWTWPTVISAHIPLINKASYMAKLDINVAGKYTLPLGSVGVGGEREWLLALKYSNLPQCAITKY